MFLTGAIGIISGMLPNVQGKYFSRNVGPNLYCFIIGKYGTGKGSLVWAKDLGRGVEKYRTEIARATRTAYDDEQMSYQRQVRLYESGKLPDPPPKPEPPRHLRLFLPANSSKTAVMQLLKENDGRGIIFETEGDTLADMLRQDYGNFSDVLRKAYHHEPISYYRRTDSEDVMIDHPQLSVVMSGTHDQLRRLIPTIENGLYSRFCFYHLQGSAPFKDPFAAEQSGLQLDIDEVAEGYLKIYKHLERLSQPVNFYLQPQQQRHFLSTFMTLKTEISTELSDELEGMANRIGLICFRIAMILSVVRHPALQSGQLLPCTDDDYYNAIDITNHLLQHSLHVYEQLQLHPAEALVPIEDKKEKIERCCQQSLLGMSISKIAESVLGSEKKKGTIHNWINRYCKKRA